MAPLNIWSSRGLASAAKTAPQAANRETSFAFGLPAPPAGTQQRPVGISLCMIVKDEERFLEACLRSAVAGVDEICIVDTGSSDRTVEIALAFGARVGRCPWRNDFAWARNEALAMATRRWILVLDADEELDPASVDSLRSLRAVPAGVIGLWVRCNNLSDEYKGSGVSTHAIVRFFPNSQRIRYTSPVHEFITLDGRSTGIEARVSPLSITHHGYLSAIVAERNKLERNLALLKTATKNDPDEPFNWYNLATTWVLCGDPDAGVAAFEKMRGIVGEAQRAFVPNALAQLADLYTDRGDCDRAIEAANESLLKAPNFANAHFALGRALAHQKRYPEARAAFEAAIADGEYVNLQFVVDNEVSSWKAHSEIGTLYGYEGNDLAALEWFDRALTSRPLVVPLRIGRAKALERLGRFVQAEAVFKQLAADEPGGARSADYLNFLLRRDDKATALSTVEEILTYVTPRVRASLLTKAAVLSAEICCGDPEDYLRRAIAAHGGAADALEALETLYSSRGDLGAVEALHIAELDAPMTLPPDYARRAARYLSMGRLDDAEGVARNGLALAPDNRSLRYNLGVVLVQSGRWEAALDELERAGADDEVGLRALLLRAIMLGDLGRHAEAVIAVDAVIALAPREVEARIHRFRFAEALGRDAEAEATLRDALALGDGRVADELATWLLRKGRFGDAQAVAELVLQRT